MNFSYFGSCVLWALSAMVLMTILPLSIISGLFLLSSVLSLSLYSHVLVVGQGKGTRTGRF